MNGFPLLLPQGKRNAIWANHANAALHSRPQASAPPQPLAIRQRHAGTDYGLALQWILTVVGPMELQILTAAVTDCQHSRALTCARSILCAPLLLRVRGPAETVQLWNGHGDYGRPDADVERKNGRWCSTSAGTSIKNDQRVELWHLPPPAALWRSVWPPPRGGGTRFHWQVWGVGQNAVISTQGCAEAGSKTVFQCIKFGLINGCYIGKSSIIVLCFFHHGELWSCSELTAIVHCCISTEAWCGQSSSLTVCLSSQS